jgi:hypothetical protein
MALLTGIAGAVNGVSGIGSWDISYKNEVTTYANSSTKGANTRLAGNFDWSGSYKSEYRALVGIPVKPGDVFTFAGSIDGTRGATGSAMVSSVEVRWDVEGNKPIDYTVKFDSCGALVLGAAVGVDSGFTLPVPAGSCIVKLDAIELTDVRTITLTLTRKNEVYSSSTTAGIRKRIKGLFDATCSISVYCDGFATLPTPGTVHQVKLYVDATTFFDITWMMTTDLSGIGADPETGKIVAATINMGYCSVKAGVAGAVKDPLVAVLYP